MWWYLQVGLLEVTRFTWGFLGGLSGKELPANAGDPRDVGSIPGVG